MKDNDFFDLDNVSLKHNSKEDVLLSKNNKKQEQEENEEFHNHSKDKKTIIEEEPIEKLSSISKENENNEDQALVAEEENVDKSHGSIKENIYEVLTVDSNGIVLPAKKENILNNATQASTVDKLIYENRKVTIEILQVDHINDCIFDRKIYFKLFFPKNMSFEMRNNIEKIKFENYSLSECHLYDKTSEYIVYEVMFSEGENIDLNISFKTNISIYMHDSSVYNINKLDVEVKGANKNLSIYNKKPFDQTAFKLQKQTKIEIIEVNYLVKSYYIYNQIIFIKLIYPKNFTLETIYNIKSVSFSKDNIGDTEIYLKTEKYMIILARIKADGTSDYIKFFEANIHFHFNKKFYICDKEDVIVEYKWGEVPPQIPVTIPKPPRKTLPKRSEEYKNYLKEQKLKKKESENINNKLDENVDALVVKEDKNKEVNMLSKVNFKDVKKVGDYGLNVYTTFTLPCLGKNKKVELEWIQIEGSSRYESNNVDFKSIYKDKIINLKEYVELLIFLKKPNIPNSIKIKKISYKIKNTSEVIEIKTDEVLVKNKIGDVLRFDDNDNNLNFTSTKTIDYTKEYQNKNIITIVISIILIIFVIVLFVFLIPYVTE